MDICVCHLQTEAEGNVSLHIINERRVRLWVASLQWKEQNTDHYVLGLACVNVVKIPSTQEPRCLMYAYF